MGDTIFKTGKERVLLCLETLYSKYMVDSNEILFNTSSITFGSLTMAEREVNFRGRSATRGPRGRGRGLNTQSYAQSERRPVSIEREYVSFEDNSGNGSLISRGRQPLRKVNKQIFEGRYFERESEEDPPIKYTTCPKCKGGRFMVSVLRSQDWYLCQNCRGSGLVDVTDVWDLEVKKDMIFYANKGCRLRAHVCSSCHELEKLPVKNTMDGFIPFSAVCTNQQRRVIPKMIRKDSMEWASQGYDPDCLNDVIVVLDNKDGEGGELPPPKKTRRQEDHIVSAPSTPPPDRRILLDQMVASPSRGLASRYESMHVYSSWTAERRTLVQSVVQELETLHEEIVQRVKNDRSIEDLVGLIKGTVWSLMDPNRRTPCSMLRQMWAAIITRVKVSIPEDDIRNLWMLQIEDPAVVFERRLTAKQLSIQLLPNKNTQPDLSNLNAEEEASIVDAIPQGSSTPMEKEKAESVNSNENDEAKE